MYLYECVCLFPLQYRIENNRDIAYDCHSTTIHRTRALRFYYDFMLLFFLCVLLLSNWNWLFACICAHLVMYWFEIWLRVRCHAERLNLPIFHKTEIFRIYLNNIQRDVEWTFFGVNLFESRSRWHRNSTRMLIINSVSCYYVAN